jgi:hypothetical protein
MNRTHLQHLSAATLFAAVTTLTISGTALADIAPQGTMVLGAERLFGIVGTGTDTDGVDSDSTRISLLWGGGPVSPIGPMAAPYDRSRIAFDYFIIDNLSLGGSLGFYSWSASVEDDDTGDGGGFLLSPRVGYMVDITDMLGFWPRGGFTYVRDSVEDPDVVATATALSVEAPLYILIGRTLAINVGLTIDLGLGGEIEQDAPLPDVDQEHNQFGIQVGLSGFL